MSAAVVDLPGRRARVADGGSAAQRLPGRAPRRVRRPGRRGWLREHRRPAESRGMQPRRNDKGGDDRHHGGTDGGERTLPGPGPVRRLPLPGPRIECPSWTGSATPGGSRREVFFGRPCRIRGDPFVEGLTPSHHSEGQPPCAHHRHRVHLPRRRRRGPGRGGGLPALRLDLRHRRGPPDVRVQGRGVRVEALLLGRRTYEGFAAAWPEREGSSRTRSTR